MTNPFRALCSAIAADDQARVKALLDKDCSVALRGASEKSRFESKVGHWLYEGDTALHLAAAGYRVEIARMLLAASAEIGAARSRRRAQPLHYASDGSLASPSWDAERQVAMIRLLLQAGAEINAQDKNGATPLHRAVRTRCASVVDCLLKAGADPALQNMPGSTAFHLAVQNTGRGGSGSPEARIAQREIIRSFMNSGVRPSLMDAHGKSVLDWATSPALAELLR